MNTPEVIIVGAGMAGLIAAQRLKQHNVQALILDKSSSVGGRLATRRVGEGVADHGAQFFTVRTHTFQAYVDQWLSEGLVRIWGYGWSDGSMKRSAPDGHARYIAHDGMNSIARRIARDLDPDQVRVNAHIASISYQDGLWVLADEADERYVGKRLIVTPPVPQTLALLEGIALHDDDRDALERIQYGPCLCGIFVVEGGVDLPEPGALQNFDSQIYWIADNRAKGISNTCVVTMHVEHRYSRQHYDDPEALSLAFMRNELERYLLPSSRVIEEQLKKWRYSLPLITHPYDCMVAQGYPLVFAGDAFGGRGRVEGAFYSGYSAADAILAMMHAV